MQLEVQAHSVRWSSLPIARRNGDLIRSSRWVPASRKLLVIGGLLHEQCSIVTFWASRHLSSHRKMNR